MTEEMSKTYSWFEILGMATATFCSAYFIIIVILGWKLIFEHLRIVLV